MVGRFVRQACMEWETLGVVSRKEFNTNLSY